MLTAGELMDAAALDVRHEPVPFAQVVAGAPTTGYQELSDGVGVWEMTPGAMRDVEADEIFVVLSGDASVEFIAPALPAIALRVGSLVRLEAGMSTVWTVRDTLRKVYVSG
jgi:uncharacterized cupin superfamily protein